MKNWNPVFNWAIEVKNEYINHFGSVDYSEIGCTCIERWITELKNQDWIDLIEPLEINQYSLDSNCILLLFRYGKYSSYGDTLEEIEEFWNKNNGFYRECRSLVIDIVNEKIVNCPFKKFFNLNEREETSLENVKKRIKEASIIELSEKIDGSMQCANWYQNKLILTGAQGMDPNCSWRIAEGYKMLQDNPSYEKMIKDYPECTFIFEYVSLKDSHVVKYTTDQQGMYLIGIRNNKTGAIKNYGSVIEIASQYNIKSTVLYTQTLEEFLQELDKYKSNEREGVVLFIDNYQLKIKYNDYVYIHRVLSYFSSINLIIKAVADGTFDDLISKVPELYKENILQKYNQITKYVKNKEKEIERYYNLAISNSNDRKSFMIFVDKEAPLSLAPFVKSKYLNHSYNLLKLRSGRYLSAAEIGIGVEDNEDNEY